MKYYFPLIWMRNLIKFDGEEIRIRHAQNNGTSVGICTLGMVSFIE